MKLPGVLLSVMLVAASLPARAADYPADPLGSPMWTYHAERIFGAASIRYDPRVKLVYPEIAENQRAFPVALDARGVAGVKRMLIFADLNPIPVAIDYRPGTSLAYIATRIKLDQRTPVRGAVQLQSGEWLVSGGWVDAAGGGCSAPPVSRGKGDWAQHLGEMRGAAWPIAGTAGGSLLRLTIRHPMDTGLVENIGLYHLQHLAVKDASGAALGEMEIWASVAEDPAITVMPVAARGTAFVIDSRDTNGRTYAARIEASGASLALR